MTSILDKVLRIPAVRHTLSQSRCGLRLQCRSAHTGLAHQVDQSRLPRPRDVSIINSWTPPTPNRRSRALRRVLSTNASSPNSTPSEDRSPPENTASTIRENIYTLPNFLTLTRILACPVLGWSIITGDFYLASGLVVYAGLTDYVCSLLHLNKRHSHLRTS